MTTQHWYDDSNGKWGGFSQESSFPSCHDGVFFVVVVVFTVEITAIFYVFICLMALTVQLWNLSVLNHWQQSIHKVKFTSSLRDFPQGASSPCQNDTATVPTSNDTDFSQHGHWLSASLLLLQGRTEKQTFLDVYLHAYVCACVLTLPPPGYDEKQFRPGWLFPVLVLLHTGSRQAV